MCQHKELDFGFWGTIQGIVSLQKGTYKGYEGEQMLDLRAMGGTHPGLLGHVFYVSADSPYETVAELLETKPLRIGVGPTGSASWRTCQWALEAYGVTYDDIEAAGGLVHFGPVGDASTMMAEGKLDGFAYGLSHPSPLLEELDLKRGVRCLKWSDEAIEAVVGDPEHGLFVDVIPAGTYEGTPYDVPMFNYTEVAYVNKDMADDVAYNLAAAFFSERTGEIVGDTLAFMKGQMATFPKLTADYTWPVEFHPGALKYWAERGITPKVDVIK